MHVRMHGCMHAWHAYMDAWMHAYMDAWMHACMDAWLHGCRDAGMHVRMDGWMSYEMSYEIALATPNSPMPAWVSYGQAGKTWPGMSY